LSEQVLVVPRPALVPEPGWRGVRSCDLPAVLATIEAAGRFEPRAAVEDDPGLKQLIPYLVVRDGSSYFLMRRTRGGADARLHDLGSIGVGGHLNPGDDDVLGGLRREWHEEVEAAFDPQPRFVGLLNDDTTPVGRVHLGLVFEIDAAGRPVAIREKDKLSGGFAPADAVRAVADQLETWSRLVFEHLDDPDRRSVGL
jgi:predicted NUDIX family phosphoesterase